MTQQLTLNLKLPESIHFDNFVTGDNAEAVQTLQQFFTENAPQYCYLWGEHGVGRSHLLQAVCHAADQQYSSALYLPLSEYEALSPDILSGLENVTLLAVDDVDAIAGDAKWEEALFHCYNHIMERGGKLIIAGNVAPAQLPVRLADLKSRLSAGVIYHVKPLTDEQKCSALQLRANERGMTLPDKVASYLLTHHSRNMTNLFAILDRLDRQSLAEQRLLTIPFVKSAL